MIVKPIPLHMLTDTVQYRPFQEGDGITTEDGFGDAITLSNVRVQYLSNISKNTNSEELKYEAMLFYDVVNSNSSDAFEFTEKSEIDFDGKTMVVEKVNPVHAFKLHHYEIGLV
ncbi:hypothetical protein CHH83_20890 [Bacillus sp. 7586-K]|nr:hypothetical protein CHH83_20890 [Bacillus sp. 7586-K]